MKTLLQTNIHVSTMEKLRDYAKSSGESITYLVGMSIDMYIDNLSIIERIGGKTVKPDKEELKPKVEIRKLEPSKTGIIADIMSSKT